MRFKLPILAIALLAPAAALAAGFTVPTDQSRVLPFRGTAASVVVGSRDIADVRAIDTHTLVVIGKRPGVTDIKVYDQAGRLLFDDQVVVSANAGAAVTIYRGASAQEMTCSPYCQAVSGSAPAPSMPAAAPTVTVSQASAPAAPATPAPPARP